MLQRLYCTVLYCTVLYCTVLQWLDRMCGITPTSKRGQIVYMFIMLLIPLIPIFALITQNMLLLNNIIVRKADLISSDQSVLKSDETAKLIRWVATLVWCSFNIPGVLATISANNIAMGSE